MKTMALAVLICGVGVRAVFGCTTLAIGKDATADGSVIVTHSDDALGDLRAIYVPAQDHPAGALHRKNPETARQYLTQHCLENAEKVVAAWWQLGDNLIAKYADGYRNQPKLAVEVGYSPEWLERVNHKNGPTAYPRR